MSRSRRGDLSVSKGKRADVLRIRGDLLNKINQLCKEADAELESVLAKRRKPASR